MVRALLLACHKDAWGNITQKQSRAGDASTYTAAYTNNRRVGFAYGRAGNLTNGTSRTYVYDAMGRVVAEYSSQSPSGAGGLKYIMADAQGSTRVVTDKDGVPVVRRDYEPFGGEIGAGVGARTPGQKYGELEATRQRRRGSSGTAKRATYSNAQGTRPG